MDGIARRKKDYLDTIHRLIPEHLLPVFISPTGFNDIAFQDRRRRLSLQGLRRSRLTLSRMLRMFQVAVQVPASA